MKKASNTSMPHTTKTADTLQTAPPRRSFLLSASSFAIAGSLPTIESLTKVAHAAGSTEPASVGGEYKAIVCVFLYGGQDASNVLIPYFDGNAAGNATAATNIEYDTYASARSGEGAAQNEAGSVGNPRTGNLSFKRSSLAATALAARTTNGVSAVAATGGFTTNTHGRQFALHPSLLKLKGIFDAGKLAVVANVGPLVAPLTRHNVYTGTGGARPANLYSHDDQQKGWMSGTANVSTPPASGIGGRIGELLAGMNGASQIALQVSVDGSNTFQLTSGLNAIPYQVGYGNIGRITPSTPPSAPLPVGATCNTSSSYIAANPTSAYCISGGPIRITNGYSFNTTLYNAFRSRVGGTNNPLNLYLDQWGDTADQSIKTEQAVAAALLASPLTEDIVGPFQPIIGTGNTFNSLAAQLRMVAGLIRASATLGPATPSVTPVKRQIFFVSIGGFDTHGDEFWDNNPTQNTRIGDALKAFWDAMGNIAVQGAAGSTARDRVTLFTATDFGRTLDSNGQGSDHGWGSHQFVMGGAVLGGSIYGKNHNVTTAELPQDTGNAANKTRWMKEDTTAGAVPRTGIPPDRYDNATGTGPGAKCNGLNHSLDRGEMLPTMAGDAYIATIARWFGVQSTDLASVFPTLATAHPTGSDVGFMNLTM